MRGWGRGANRAKRQSLPRPKRRLVEECNAISIHAVQAYFGKPALLRAIREARPVRVPVAYHAGFDVYLTSSSQPMVGNPRRSFERLYLVCPGCQHRVAKLFHYAGSDLRCRRCHRLVYLTTNCGGNQWYRQVGRPIKRLLRERERLVGRADRPEVSARLVEIARNIRLLEKQVQPQRPNRRVRRARQKGRYRDIRLLN
jgi:hypothetical protein